MGIHTPEARNILHIYHSRRDFLLYSRTCREEFRVFARRRYVTGAGAIFARQDEHVQLTTSGATYKRGCRKERMVVRSQQQHPPVLA